MKESDADKREENEEVKDDRISNPVECVTSAEDEDATDIKPPNVRVFHLAEIPATTETVEVIDEGDDQSQTSDVSSEISTVHTKELFKLKCDRHKVLLFFVKKQISPKEVKKLFLESEAFEGVTDVQKTVTGVDKFKGVYVVSFSSEEFARNCVEVDVELNGNLLDKVLLRDYKSERFFLRQIRKTRGFKLNQDFLMDNLKDVKEDAKLENCVVIQVDAEEEDVMEHFCGISSDFVDNFEFPVEEVKVITAPKIPQYVLVFESSEGAMSFKKQPEYHNVGEKKATDVILLTERMKRVRFGEKIKNFVDDKSFSAADNDRRLMVSYVARDASLEAVTSMMTSLFPDHKHLLRCQIEDFFWGLYVVTFSTREEAEAAATTEIEENEVIKNPIAMVLTEYCLQREHFLNSKMLVRRKRHANESEENRWRKEFVDIEKRHEEYWGPFETKSDRKDNDDDSCDEDYNPMEMLKSNC